MAGDDGVRVLRRGGDGVGVARRELVVEREDDVGHRHAGILLEPELDRGERV